MRYIRTVIALSIVALLLGLWFCADSAAPSASGPAVDERSAFDGGGREAVHDDGGEEAIRTAVEGRAPASAVAVAGGAAGSGSETFAGTVLDPDGAPLAEASVELLRGLGDHDLEEGDRATRAREVVTVLATDADGRFRFRVVRARSYDLRVAADGLPVTVVPHCYGGQDRTIRLSRGATLIGQVTRAEDGSPIEGAIVRGRLPWRIRLFDATTDAAGRYRAGDLAPGVATVDVSPPIGEGVLHRTIELRAGEVAELDLSIRRGDLLEGRVFDLGTGAPVSGASVESESGGHVSARSGPDGRFAIRGFPTRDDFLIRVVARGYARAWRGLREVPAERGRRTVDVGLSRGGRARGRVVGADGRPLAGIHVAAIGGVVLPGFRIPDLHATRTGSDGGYSIDDLGAAPAYELVVRAPGHGTLDFAFPEPVTPGATVALPDVVLEPCAAIEGFVNTDAGEPVADCSVRLDGGNRDRDAWSDAIAGVADTYVRSRRARTDARGWFAFTDLAAGEYSLAASARGGLSTGSRVSVEAGELHDGVTLTLTVGASIAGTVLRPDGSPIDVAILSVRAVGDPGGEPRTAYARAGQFTIRGLSPGRYRIEASTLPGAGCVGTAVEAETGAGERIEIRLRAGAVIAGRLLDASGRPAPGRWMSARDHGGTDELAFATSEPDGSFRFDVPSGSVVDLIVWPRDGDGGPETLGSAEAGIAAPVFGLELRLAR